MKTISDYTIHCTVSQTRKALELGAPIEPQTPSTLIDTLCAFCGDGMYIIPTAEQLIGWLEEQEDISEFDIAIWEKPMWAFRVHLIDKPSINGMHLFTSRKEATLAAIDAALEYLTNNKK